MTKHTLINVAIFSFILAAMVGIQGIDDNGPEQEIAKQELAKQRQQERFERAARDICGENATWALTHVQGQIVCKTRRGHKTGQTASL